MLEFEIETKKLNELVQSVSLSGTIEEPVFQFNENRLFAINRDIANVVLAYNSFSKGWFTSFLIKEDETEKKFCFNASRLQKIIKPLSGEKAKVKVDIKKNNIEIKTEKEERRVPLIVSSMKKTDFPPFINIDENNNVTFKEEFVFQLSEKIPILKAQQLDALGEDISVFSVADGVLSIVQETKDGWGSSDILKNGINSIDFFVVYVKDYLKNIFSSVISSDIEIKTGKDLPFVAIDHTKDFTLLYALAPRVEEE